MIPKGCVGYGTTCIIVTLKCIIVFDDILDFFLQSGRIILYLDIPAWCIVLNMVLKMVDEDIMERKKDQ